ncbi:hypothetical protein D3C81_2224400 [compost metagenome]
MPGAGAGDDLMISDYHVAGLEPGSRVIVLDPRVQGLAGEGLGGVDAVTPGFAGGRFV